MGWFRRHTASAPAPTAEPDQAAEPAQPAAPAAATQDDLDEIRHDVAALKQQLDARLSALDSRITSMGTELANQLTELSHDIDSVSTRPPDGATITALRDGQARLANEQARYQIAFLEDLSELAEQIQHLERAGARH